MSDNFPQISPLVVGLRCKCPQCGEGPLFDGFLTIRKRCQKCNLDLSIADSGDGPAVFVIFIIGPIATGLALLTESIFTPPYWLHLVVWPPLILGGVVALLRPFKATLIALQFKYKAREGGRSSLDQ
jgi:uncharacterized protein (DUF983 family)